MEQGSDAGEASGAPRVLSAVGGRVARASEIIVVASAGILVMAAVLVAAAALFLLFYQGVRANLGVIESVEQLQAAVQSVFAGVLLLMLGLELLETLKSYFTESQIRIEVILVVALIAVARHLMLIDIAHADGLELLGAAALTLALAVSYVLIRRSRSRGGMAR
jgi:uncharacterized membrane protein (DUF373 family)